MKIFKLLDYSFSQFTLSMKSYLSKTLSNFNTSYSNNTIFGQLINVTSSVVQNIMLYIEDALVEQNKYTAQRKKSIYSLARLSGYNPSLGTASGAQVRLSFKPNNEETLNVVIKNKEQLTCSQNGLQYNIILPQEAIIMNLEKNNDNKYIYIVEGKFETQSFVSTGGQLYSQNVVFNGDIDFDYLEVYINNELWERKDSLYDMDPDGKNYCCYTSLHKGIDLIFGNDQHGRSLKEDDVIKVVYLIHDGELGNININYNTSFTFNNTLTTIDGSPVDGNNIFNIHLATNDNISAGTSGEDKELVSKMIGYNSRSLVLSDEKNYKQFINKFSFCGYNRTWSTKGSLVVNSLIIKNYNMNLINGVDYFNLDEKDFKLSDIQKQTLKNCIINSGNQLAGVTYNIVDPVLYKYAIYLYIKLKSSSYDQTYVTGRIRELVGNFFSNIPSDLYIPKSDIIQLIKDNVPEIDGVDLYFLSEKNEKALINRQYIDTKYKYDASTNSYKKHETLVYLENNEDPGLGLDDHGNIYLENDEQFPVIMGGWSYKSNTNELTNIDDPLIITFY